MSSPTEPAAENKPIPFKPEHTEPLNANAPMNPQTSYADCKQNGGHGGPDGKRVYYARGLLGKMLEEPLICEICGAVDIA